MKKSIVLLVIVLLVAAYVYWFEVRKESKIPSTDEIQTASKTLTGVKTEDIKGFALAKTGNPPISAEYAQGEWTLTGPVKSATEEATVNSIVYDIVWTEKSLVSEAKDVTPEKLKGYGLDNPAGTIDVTLKDKTLHYIIGGANLAGSEVYVRAGNDGPVYLVGKKFAGDLDTTVFQLRNKTVMPLVAAQVGYVKLFGSTKASIERKDGQWNLLEPFSDYADAETMTTLVKDANGLTVSEFVSEDPATFGQYGLNEPQSYVSFGETAAGGKTYTINLGNEAPASATGDKMIYAATAGGKTAFKLKADSVAKLFPTLAQLQCKTLARLDRYALKKLTLTYGLNEVQLSHPDYDWKVVKPYEADADNRVVEDVLANLYDARITQIVTTEPEKDRYGIETPTASFSFVESNKAPVGVVFGADAGDGTVYAKRTDTPAVFETPAALLRKLATPALKFHSLDMQKVAISSVDTLGITRGEESFTIKRQVTSGTADVWRMTKPAEAPTNPAMMSALEATLATTRAVELIEDNAADMAKYGLDKPAVRVDFEMISGTKPKSLLVGAQADGGKRYAMLEGGQIVFTVAPDLGRALFDEVRDTRVFAFKPSDATRIEFTLGDRKLTFVKSDKEWKSENASDRAPSQSAVWSELDHLSQLVTTKFENYKMADLAKYGLDKPQAVVRIVMPYGVAALSVGSMAQTGHYYSTSTSVDGVFLMTPGDVAKVLEPDKLFETAAAKTGEAAPSGEIEPQKSGENAQGGQPTAGTEAKPQEAGEGVPASTSGN